MGGDQRGADARVETNLFIDGFCITLEGAGVSSLGLAKHRADQAIKHIDGPIGQTGGNVQTNGDQRCVSPAAFVTSDMLGGGAPGFARKLGEPRLMDQVATAWFDANLTDVFQTLDQTEHRGWFGGFWHLLPRGAADRLTALAPLRRSEWVVYAKRPFAGPQAVLAYLSRYTHRVAISNSRLIALDDNGVTFRWKDYRARRKAPGKAWIKPMTLTADEFIRRFLLHVLPSGFHRIRHYGFFASPKRAANIGRLRDIIAARDGTLSREVGARENTTDPERAKTQATSKVCPCCGGPMRVVETFARSAQPQSFTAEPAGIDSS